MSLKPVSVFFSFSFNRRCFQPDEKDFFAEPIILAALGFLFVRFFDFFPVQKYGLNELMLFKK